MNFSTNTSLTNGKAIDALRITLALAFAAAGIAKVMGVEALVATFDAMGFGQWLRWFTAILEITAAAVILVPRLAFWAALLMMCISVGAAASQVLFIGDSPLPPLVLLVLSGLFAGLARPNHATP